MRQHPLSRAVSAVLRAIAAKKQIDQHTIAKRTGYTADKVSRLLGSRRTGTQPIGLDDADMICNALDANLMEVIAEAIRDTPDRPKRLPTAAEIFEKGF